MIFMMSKLPTEIWLNVIDILGNEGELRDMTNLISALSLDQKIGNKFREIELNKERKTYRRDYKQQMIDFWNRTGIDDGVPRDYLLHNLNLKTRMYRTIWSYDVYKTKDETYTIFPLNLYESIQHTMEDSHSFKTKFTSLIFQDKRYSCNCLHNALQRKERFRNCCCKIEQYN